MAVFDADTLERLKKKPKGSATMERRAKRASIVQNEKSVKAEVTARDGAKACRLDPACPYIRTGWSAEGVHLDDKGFGGDHGVRTTRDLMLRGCKPHHQGPRSLHSGHLRVKYLTAKKADGPIALMRPDVEIENRSRIAKTVWVEFAREKAVGVWMTPREFAAYASGVKEQR